MERRISRLRVRPTERIRKDGAPSRRALRDGSIPPGGQSRVGGTGAHCAPLRGGTHSPSCCNSKWVEAVWRDNAFTREARPEGERVIRKRERTLVLSLLCAVRPRRPRPHPLGAGTNVAPFKTKTDGMARRGRGTRRNGAPRSWPRPASLGPSAQFTFSRPTKSRRPRRPRSRPRCAGSSVTPCKAIPPPMAMGARRTPQVQSLTGPLRQRLTALPPPLKGEARWVVQTASVGCAVFHEERSLRAPAEC